MKQSLWRKLIGTAGALMFFAVVIPASAGPPDFSICDGLIEDARGICRAGVAVGCADGTGNPTACGNIEDQFSQVTGTEPPWGAPPSACPCDFEQLAMSSWSATEESPLHFSCSTCTPVYTVLESDDYSMGIGMWQEMWGYWGYGPYGYGGYPGYGEYPGYGWGDPSASCEEIYSCAIFDDGVDEYYVTELTVEEADACAQDVIDYVQAFMELYPDVPVNDTCTPALSP